MAQAEAQAQVEKAAELAALELERPLVEIEEPSPTQTLEERARALFKDLAPAPAESEHETAEETTSRTTESVPHRSSADRWLRTKMFMSLSMPSRRSGAMPNSAARS